MATSEAYFARPSHRYLHIAGNRDTLSQTMDSDSAFEFDESDIYHSVSDRVNSLEFRKSLCGSRMAKKSSCYSSAGVGSVGAPASLPVNVPDWSKILGKEYRDNNNRWMNNLDDSDEEGFDGESEKVPPHEFLARTRMASLSVHEGVGRTLKGRDLSRVRNAIWAKTGFQD